MMSSICLAMTTVSFGVAASAGPATRTIAASSQVILFMYSSFRCGPGPGAPRRAASRGPGPAFGRMIGGNDRLSSARPRGANVGGGRRRGRGRARELAAC
mgnify:CR=1 FL=1